MSEKISKSVIENMPAGQFRQPSLENVFTFAQAALAKQRQRSQLLKEHPELVIDVDSVALSEVLPGSALVCYTGSSVARNRAIRGSDIDGAIVITHRPTSLDQQRQYVFALRKQGFKVYSPQQIHNISEAGHLHNQPAKKQDIAFKVVTFETLEEFAERRQSGASLVHIKFFTVYADEVVVSSSRALYLPPNDL